MDMSIFYEELKNEFLAGVIAVCVLVAGVIYLGVCVLKAKSPKKWTKMLSTVALLAVLLFAINLLVTTVIPMKKDLNQQSIIHYEGTIEIVEACYTGWKPLGDVIIRMDGEEYHLYFGRDEQFFTAFEEGTYIGEIVYLRNAKRIMFFEATPV